jgi:hypothetical protein
VRTAALLLTLCTVATTRADEDGERKRVDAGTIFFIGGAGVAVAGVGTWIGGAAEREQAVAIAGQAMVGVGVAALMLGAIFAGVRAHEVANWRKFWSFPGRRRW